MIYVIATITTKPGSRAALLKVFEGLVPKVLAEKGCIQYTPTIDVPSEFAPVREDVVTMVEKWESLAALQAHLATPHMADFRKQTESLRLQLTLNVIEPA